MISHEKEPEGGRTTEERRKGPIEYVREEADEATERQLERDASKEADEEEQKTGGALPRTRSSPEADAE